MSSLEERPNYAYTLPDCLEHFAQPYSVRDSGHVQYILDDAYKSVLIPSNLIMRHPMRFDQYIATYAALNVLEKDRISVFATLMQQTQDEDPIDSRLKQWRDFGVYEPLIREGIHGTFQLQRAALETEIDSILYSIDYEESRTGQANMRRDTDSIRNELGRLTRSIAMLQQVQTGHSGESN